MDHTRTELANGLRLLTIPMPAMRSTTIAVYLGLGSRYEPEAQAGVSHLIEHMLFRGTERWSRPGELSQVIESVGGVLNASTDKEITVYWAKVAQTDLPLAVDVLSGMLRHSLLRPADLARERGVVLEELHAISDDPADLALTVAEEMLWPGQAIGREIAGTPQSVSRLQRRHLQEYLRTFYGPNNAVISIAGGVEGARAAELVAQHFADWQPVHPPSPPPAVMSHNERVRLEYRPTEQVNLCLAYPGVSRFHPDRNALDLLSNILGGGPSARLFTELRERRGLVYDVYAYADHLSDTGAFMVFAAADPRRTGDALDSVLREIERVQRRRVPDAELQRAKQAFRGRLYLGLEDTQAVANWFGTQEILHHSVMPPEEVAADMDAVTADDLMRVARTYLTPDQAHLAAVGPANELGLEGRIGA